MKSYKVEVNGFKTVCYLWWMFLLSIVVSGYKYDGNLLLVYVRGGHLIIGDIWVIILVAYIANQSFRDFREAFKWQGS